MKKIIYNLILWLALTLPTCAQISTVRVNTVYIYDKMVAETIQVGTNPATSVTMNNTNIGPVLTQGVTQNQENVNFTGILTVNNEPVVTNPALFVSVTDTLYMAIQTNFVSYTPTNIINTSSNMLDLANGWLQTLILTNTTLLYAPTSPDTNQIHGLRLELYIGTNSFTLGTNSLYIGTNNTIGSGVTDFMARLQTNRYNSLLFDKGIGETYFRIFGLNI